MASLAMMRLASPSLPIGGFSYSQGLESAVDLAWVTDQASMVRWLEQCLAQNIGRFEAPICYALFAACQTNNSPELNRLHQLYLASKESAELLAETKQMGYSLVRLLANLETVAFDLRDTCQHLLDDSVPCALPLAWAWAANSFGLSAQHALDAYLWAWAENQVAAAIKTVPLGQQAGQNILGTVGPLLAQVSERAPTIAEDDWSNFSPGFVTASCRHEQQYSRLFRS